MNILTGKGNKEKKSTTAAVNEKTYVTMTIGNDKFGIDVARINTVYGMTEIRGLPNTKPYMLGVITFRDTVIPVIDLRIKFNLMKSSGTSKSVIVITLIRGRYIGLIVDFVYDVVSVSIDQIQSTPHLAENIDQDCIEGIITVDGQLVVLVNADAVLSEDDVQVIKEQQSA